MPHVTDLNHQDVKLISIHRIKHYPWKHVIRYVDPNTKLVTEVCHDYTEDKLIPSIEFIDHLSIDNNGVVRWRLHTLPALYGRYVAGHLTLKLGKEDSRSIHSVLSKIMDKSKLDLEIINYFTDLYFMKTPDSKYSFAKLYLGNYPELWKCYGNLHSHKHISTMDYCVKNRVVRLLKRVGLGKRIRLPTVGVKLTYDLVTTAEIETVKHELWNNYTSVVVLRRSKQFVGKIPNGKE